MSLLHADQRRVEAIVIQPPLHTVGGVAILDEGNRMSEKSWASLAPLLDTRRYVESIVAGIKIQAHPDFRICATMNEDASTFELPEYVHSRIQPQIYLDFPDRDEELQILSQNLPFADAEILAYVVNFLQLAHAADEKFTVRDGINIAGYALKVLQSPAIKKAPHLQLVDRRPLASMTVFEALRQVVPLIVGADALTYLRAD